MKKWLGWWPKVSESTVLECSCCGGPLHGRALAREERQRERGARTVVRMAQTWGGYRNMPPERLAELTDDELLEVDNVGLRRLKYFRSVYGYGVEAVPQPEGCDYDPP